jgi:integrase
LLTASKTWRAHNKNAVAGELAANRNPAETLKQSPGPRKRETLREVAKRYEVSRAHLLENGRRNDSSHLGRILATLGDRDPQTLGFGDVQEWIAENTKTPENETGLLPSSLSRYVNTLRQLLDFAGLEPNPARSKHVKLPRIVQEEVDPPTATQTLAILERVGPRWKLPLIVLEQTAMRSGEVAKLVWGDVDVVESRSAFPVARRRATGPAGCRCRGAHGARRRHLSARGSKRRASCLPPRLDRRSREGGQGRLQDGRGSPVHPAPTAAPSSHHLAPRRRPGQSSLRACRTRERGPDPEPLQSQLDPGEVPRKSLEALLVWPGCGPEDAD